jgi:hypothetical protein
MKDKTLQAAVETHRQDDRWLGQVWSAWKPDNQSSTPDYLLVTEHGNIDLPLAIVHIQQRYAASAQSRAIAYGKALNAAVRIAQDPSAVDTIEDVIVEDWRQIGRPGSLAPVPRDLHLWRCVALADPEGTVKHCDPFSRPRFNKMLRQFIEQQYSAKQLEEHPLAMVGIHNGDDGTFDYINPETGKIVAPPDV